MKRLALFGVPVLATLAALACSANDGTGGPSGGSNAVSGTGGAGSTSFNLGGGSSTPTGSAQLVGTDTCGGQIYQGEGRSLDMAILMDRSGSMLLANTWAPIGTALGDFVASPQAEGMGAGIQFFPMGPDPGCDVNVYANPVVPILPMTANAPAIQTAIANNGPLFGGTPTLPAMQGWITYAQGWANANPARKTIIVLATDGDPNDCNSTAQAVADEAARALAGPPSIPTYVIGIGNIAALNQIAAAGGTGQAIIVAADPNVARDQFMQAMQAIRGAALPCDYSIPPEGVDTPDLVNLKFQASSSAAVETIPYVGDANGCSTAPDGWYYADINGTRRIVTCPQTCQRFNAVSGTSVGVSVGCKQVTVIQ